VRIKRRRGFLLRHARESTERKKLGVLAIMKNEAMNLREWIEHYLWQGVDKIFLIDNGSTDGGSDLVKQEVEGGSVEIFFRSEPHRQCAHYHSVFVQARIWEKVEWLVMADLDEFWYCPGSNLPAALEGTGDLDLIYANWRMFGSSGYKAHPASLRRYLVHRQPALGAHSDTKWICRTDAIKDTRQIMLHKVHGIDSSRVVSDNERFHLNHYAIQSLEYFTKVKMRRGDASTPQFDAIRTLEYFDRYDSPAIQVDRTLADMLPD
jgi:glycosyltransferase involved in cell wall biosynthesis